MARLLTSDYSRTEKLPKETSHIKAEMTSALCHLLYTYYSRGKKKKDLVHFLRIPPEEDITLQRQLVIIFYFLQELKYSAFSESEFLLGFLLDHLLLFRW